MTPFICTAVTPSPTCMLHPAREHYYTFPCTIESSHGARVHLWTQFVVFVVPSILLAVAVDPVTSGKRLHRICDIAVERYSFHRCTSSVPFPSNIRKAWSSRLLLSAYALKLRLSVLETRSHSSSSSKPATSSPASGRT